MITSEGLFIMTAIKNTSLVFKISRLIYQQRGICSISCFKTLRKKSKYVSCEMGTP